MKNQKCTSPYQVIGGISVQPSDLDEAPLAGKLQVQVFGDGGPGDSVGHVGAGQELVAQVQQLDVQGHSFLPLQTEEGVALKRGGRSARSASYSHRQVTEPHQFVVQVNPTDLKVKHEQFCHTSGENQKTPSRQRRNT